MNATRRTWSRRGRRAAPAVAGYVAPKALNALHGDSTENLGHNVFGAGKLWGGEKEANVAGSVLAGAAAGAAMGSVVPGIGTVVGGVIGGVVGGISSIFDW